MASAIQRDPAAGAKLTNVVGQQELVGEQVRRLGLSQRQIELNRLYAYARAQQHENCVVDWDGSRHPTALDRDALASSDFLPEGWKDPGGNLQSMPLRYRRPSVPCHLGKVIPARFTSLLFGEGTHPTWKVPGQPETEAWCEAVSETYGLWSKMALVRDLGGAMGTGIVGFKLIASQVIFEEFDPRWCFPTFNPRNPDELDMLEVRYMFPQEILDQTTGQWREEKFWYRRIVDKQMDCLWKPTLVGDGSKEPDWKDKNTVADLVEHKLGFVPIQWTQNIVVAGDIDGDPDCHGCYDYFDRIGELKSQAHKGAQRNADPTATISSDGQFAQVAMGSDEVLKLEKGGTAGFLESSGTAVETADKEALSIRALALETAECVLPDQEERDGGPITATEINKKSAAMYSKAARMRVQYGNKCLIPLMGKLIKAVQSVTTATAKDGAIVRGQEIALPPHVVKGQPQQYKLDPSAAMQLKLEWPPFSEPTPEETGQVATATVALRNAQIITAKTATRKVAPYFNIEDIDAEVAQAKKEAPAASPDLGAQSLTELNEGR